MPPVLAEGRLVDSDPLSEPTVNLVKSWVRDCVENYPHCEWKEGEYVLPTRVIDVGCSDEPLALRLTDGEAKSGTWISLSHTRGGKVLFTTQSSNIYALKESIPMGKLPATFRDAILITRALEVRYLWIELFVHCPRRSR